MQHIQETTFIKQLSKTYIGGKWVDGKSGKDYEIKDPYDGSIVSTVSLANQDQINEAFRAAKKAQKEWAKTTAEERKEILTKALNYLKENKADILQLIIRETEEPI